MTLKKGVPPVEINMIVCDFCDAELPEPSVTEFTTGGWSYALQGSVVPMGRVCYVGVPEDKMKHSCGRELCQARLLVWSRS